LKVRHKYGIAVWINVFMDFAYVTDGAVVSYEHRKRITSPHIYLIKM
jgi:hypothetical protein